MTATAAAAATATTTTTTTTTTLDDESAYRDKIDEFFSNAEECKRKVSESYHKKRDDILAQMHMDLKQLRKCHAMNFLEKQARQHGTRQFYVDLLCQLDKKHADKYAEIAAQANEKLYALHSLFASGAYVKGTLAEYVTTELQQPGAKRKRYHDNGSRKVLMPERIVKNILIEDEIYKYFYGNPI